MAKAKKKESLSLEEKLEQALVPVDEQPYEVPENWKWVKLDGLVSIVTGKKDANYGSENGEYTFFTCAGEPIRCDGYSFEGESLLLPGNGANVGQVFYYNGKFEAYQRTYVLQSLSDNINLKYLYYQIQGFWEEYNKDKQYGSATNYIKMGNFVNYNVPVAPLAEQKRIVEQIENFFAKLDEAKEKISDVLKRCDDNMASIVHEAITGKLTETWRREYGILRDEWQVDKLGNLGTLERGRSKHRPRNDPRLFGGPYPFIQTGDVAEANVYIEKHRQTLSEFGVQQSRIFPKGTLCITIAANIGDVAILSYDCCFPDSVVGFTPYENVESKYIYYMMSELQKEIEANAPATAQKNINLKILNDIDIEIPTITEQKKIVEILEELLSKEMDVKEKAEQTIDMIDMMKKSILAKAFHGELGTNNPDEESAVELLKSIIEQEE